MSNPAAPLRDAQAVAILSQSLNAAGGSQKVTQVQDFSATGQITYFWTADGTSGKVAVKSHGNGQFRIDSTLADGVRSAVVDNGLAWTKGTDGFVRRLANQHTSNAGFLFWPYAELAAALADPSISITDLGIALQDGQQLLVIRLQETFARGHDPSGFQAKMTQRDFFISPTTFLVIRTRDLVSTRSSLIPNIEHEILFSDYRQVNGTLFPFSITELVNHQRALMVQFDDVKFNNGLGDGDFK